MLWAPLGIVLFACSVAVFLYTCGITFGTVRGGTLSAADAGVNALLFALFAAHHSLFARTPVRAFVARTMPPPRERVLYVCTASLLLMALCLLWQPLPGVVWSVTGWTATLGYLLQGVGAWLILRSATVIDARELTGLTAGSAGPPAFRSIGPYGWIRHPIYAGWLLLTGAAPLMTMDRGLFALLGAVYVLVAIPLEEGTLRRTAGAAYARYASDVRWKLVPGVY